MFNPNAILDIARTQTSPQNWSIFRPNFFRSIRIASVQSVPIATVLTGIIATLIPLENVAQKGLFALLVLCLYAVSYTHLTLPTNREV